MTEVISNLVAINPRTTSTGHLHRDVWGAGVVPRQTDGVWECLVVTRLVNPLRAYSMEIGITFFLSVFNWSIVRCGVCAPPNIITELVVTVSVLSSVVRCLLSVVL